MRKIDVHAHLYDQRYIAELDRALEHYSTPREGYVAAHHARVKARPANWDVVERLGLMERLGVDYQVLSMSIPMTYEGDAPARLRMAQISNDCFAATVEQHPDHFFAFATLPLPTIDESLVELERCLDQLHMVGVCLGSNIRGMRLDDALLAPLFEELDRRGTVIFLHPAIPVCSGPDLDAFNLSATLGYLFDTGVTVHRMISSGMFERYRRLKVIVPHLGGMLPYVAGRSDASYRSNPSGSNIPEPPSTYLKRLYFDTINFNPPSMRLAVEMFGADHLLLGSDYPLGSTGLEAAVQQIVDFGFSPEDEEQVLGGNAIRLLDLPL